MDGYCTLCSGIFTTPKKKKRHPDFVSNLCECALSQDCKVITACFFICLSSFHALFSPPAMSPLSRLDWMLKEQPCETQTLSNRKELKCAPSQAQLFFHQSVLEALESKSKNFWNPRNTRTSSCCFLHGRVEVYIFLRSLVLLCLRTLSAVSALSRPNELLHQIEQSFSSGTVLYFIPADTRYQKRCVFANFCELISLGQ